MAEITLEKIDIIKERTGVSYTEAKEALEECDSNVVNALIYIEAKQKKSAKFNMEEMYTTKDEFLAAIKDIVRKGNVTRIKIKKDETVVVDIPVNAGIAAGVIAGWFMPTLIGIGILTAVLTKDVVSKRVYLEEAPGRLGVVTGYRTDLGQASRQSSGDDEAFEVPVQIEDLDALVVAIGHVELVADDHHAVRELEGSRSSCRGRERWPLFLRYA